MKIANNKNFILVCISIILFGLCAHGYCYFNAFYSHDSLMTYQGDGNWQISIGRFLNPVYLNFRGFTYPPLLIGILSLCYLSIATYLIIKILEIKNKVLIVLASGILSTNVTIVFANATFIPYIDVFMLSLLFCIISVYISDKYHRGGVLASSVILVLSLALYQSYFQVAVFLSMILVIKTIFDGYSLKDIIFKIIRLVSSLGLGLILYYIVLKIVLVISKIELANSYNGLTDVGNYEGISIISLIKGTYAFPLIYYLNPKTHNSYITAGLNILLLILSIALILRIITKNNLQKWKLIILIGVITLMPLGMNVVYFISKGMEHDLMIYSFFLSYVFVFFLLDKTIENKIVKNIRSIVIGSILIIIFNNIVYANQIYLKKDLQYQNTLFTMTRVIDRIEQTEGYIIDETPVVFVGNLEDSVLAKPMGGVWNNTIEEAIGVGLKFSVTYDSTYSWYFRNLLAYPINIVNESEKYEERSDVKEMPSFPEKNCCKMIDEVLIMKLS